MPAPSDAFVFASASTPASFRPDADVIGPFELRAKPRRHLDALGDRDPSRNRHQREDESRGAQHNRDVESCAWRRGPRPSESAAARRLHICGDNQTFGRAALGQRPRNVARRRHLRIPEDVPAEWTEASSRARQRLRQVDRQRHRFMGSRVHARVPVHRFSRSQVLGFEVVRGFEVPGFTDSEARFGFMVLGAHARVDEPVNRNRCTGEPEQMNR